MKIQKQVIATMPKCYALCELSYKGEPHFLVATEKAGPCNVFNLSGELVDTVWTEPGGVMTMVALPDKDSAFLSTQYFFSPNDSAEAKIVLAEMSDDGEWSVRTIASMPFVHRFDLIENDGRLYFIGCCLKSDHKFRDDWSSPGKIYVCEVDRDFSVYDEDNPLPLTVLKDGLTRNHGYTRYTGNGIVQSVVSADEGVFLITPPTGDADWVIEQLIDQPTSDAILVDLDGDGEPELVTFESFHGEQLNIFRKSGDEFVLDYEHPEKLEFLHAIYGGNVIGKPGVLIGYRRNRMELFLLTWDAEAKAYRFDVIDEGAGPTNALILSTSTDEKAELVVANRETDEAAMYYLTP